MRLGGAIRPPSRRGGLLLEALVALALGVVVLAAFTGVLTSSLRWAQRLIGWSEALEVVRTVWVVLDEELRPGMVGRDWELGASGELTLRAFRGVARICPGPPEAGSWSVAYRGRRVPDPARDSVLVLGADGGWRVFDLQGVEAGGVCSPTTGESVQQWRWAQEAAPPPVLARLFERGEYHLADGALRYRRGAGGRQPLTPERVGADSGFRPVEGGIEVTVTFPALPGAGGLEPFVWPIRGTAAEAAP